MVSVSSVTESNGSSVSNTLRIVAVSTGMVALAFTLNNYLIFWQGWPGLTSLVSHLGWFGAEPLRTPLASSAVTLGFLQLASYALTFLIVIGLTLRRTGRTMTTDADLLISIAAYIARAAFYGMTQIVNLLHVTTFKSFIQFAISFVGVCQKSIYKTFLKIIIFYT